MSTSKLSNNVNQDSEDDYFSIENILACNEKIPCKFNKMVPKLGILEPSMDAENIQAGAKVELPVWLAKHMWRLGLVHVDLPRPFREGHRHILDADSTIVNLLKFSPYYYKFGLNVLHFQFAESALIAKSLEDTFRNRVRRIMDLGQNYSNGVVAGGQLSKLLPLLDREEQDLFREIQEADKQFHHWQDRRAHRISTATVIQNHKKRKRDADLQAK